ncbi:putative rnase p rpr2 rpp21 snm1 subunit domain-containing protein [Diaporthe ampelina]|uniref:Putative rnase p rpr2 rpp21 snm1 subunit domain-containing protein n=1 Tax=Diaporthe ampelina TaxID=1214573 RepID=A0A0G2FQM2_9PEZI|nr:putative rnase p rpr2 rpp21 snm1 subunit domain-containing protein [Diaporthe ampelina]
MVPSDLGPQLQFLTDAAHLLSASSPETSAFLMSKRTSLLVDHDVPVADHQRQHVCSCCGHIMVPGQGSDLKIGADRSLKDRVRKQPKAQGAPAAATSSSQKPGVSKVFTCGKCSRYTKLQLPAPKPLKARRRSKMVDRQRVVPQDKRPAATTEPARLSANASSKKRAKNRKAGLQALLDQRSGQSSGASSGLGLSLSDFMKK